MIRVFDPRNSEQPSTPAVHWHWTTLIGPDALDFLHRITTVNTQALQVGQGARGCLLNAQGKLRAYFTLWNYRETEYGLEFDGGKDDHWKESLFTAIDQYTFAEKIALVDVAGLECRWIFAEPSEEATLLAQLGLPGAEKLEAGRTLAINEEIRICHQGSRDFGRPWITVWGRPERLMQWLDRAFAQARPVSWEELEGWRISANRPWVDRELTDATIPLEVGLTDALAQNKGCYPGQEVIERIASLGSPARRLATLEGTGEPPAPGTKILTTAEPAAEIGQVTSVHASNGRFTALGFVRKIHAKEGFPIRFPGSAAQASITRIAPYAE